MRQLALAGLLLGFVGCGDNNGTPDMSTMDMSMPDLNMADLTVPPDFSGVTCGNQSCDNTTNECCASFNGSSLTESCVPLGTCNADMGMAAILCDGPEDCTGVSAPKGGCCININGSSGNADAGTGASANGTAMCGASCDGNASFDMDTGALTLSTKACHSADDCTGFTGNFNFGGQMLMNIFYDGCCTASQLGASHFCFSKQIAAQAGNAIHCQ